MERAGSLQDPRPLVAVPACATTLRSNALPPSLDIERKTWPYPDLFSLDDWSTTVEEIHGRQQFLHPMPGPEIDCRCRCLTVMIKNIPRSASQRQVLNVIISLGFGSVFNFFYLPVRGQSLNLGYGFVGFDNPDVTKQFAEAITGFRFTSEQYSTKVVSVVPAKVQGYWQCLEHFGSKCTKGGKHQPIFVRNSEVGPIQHPHGPTPTLQHILALLPPPPQHTLVFLPSVDLIQEAFPEEASALASFEAPCRQEAIVFSTSPDGRSTEQLHSVTA